MLRYTTFNIRRLRHMTLDIRMVSQTTFDIRMVKKHDIQHLNVEPHDTDIRMLRYTTFNIRRLRHMTLDIRMVSHTTFDIRMMSHTTFDIRCWGTRHSTFEVWDTWHSTLEWWATRHSTLEWWTTRHWTFECLAFWYFEYWAARQCSILYGKHLGWDENWPNLIIYVDSYSLDKWKIYSLPCEQNSSVSLYRIFMEPADIKMTSYQRRCDVITSHRRWYDVILTLCAHCIGLW